MSENQPWSTRCTGKRVRLATKNFSFTRHWNCSRRPNYRPSLSDAVTARPRARPWFINTVHPQTGLVKVSGHVYLNLLHWHLSREGDDQAQEALQRGKVATVLESLRRARSADS